MSRPSARLPRIPASIASAVLALLVAGCATAPSETRSPSPLIGDCLPESNAPLTRELALGAAGLAADALAPGTSLLIDAAALASQGRAETPRLVPTGFVSTPNGRVAVYRRGRRAPTLVLQSGLGDGMEPWSALVAALDADQAVFAYDRPGYGRSPQTPGTRNPCAVATELRGILRGTGVPPPYLLVGHSLGGLYQYAFARLYPEEVAGLLLIDPTHPDHWRRMGVETPAAATLMKTLRATVFSGTQRREFDHQTGCLADVERRPPLRVPGQLLVRTRYEPIEMGRFQSMVQALETDWRRMIGAPAIVRVCGAGHSLHRDQPQAVQRALTAMIAATAR